MDREIVVPIFISSDPATGAVTDVAGSTTTIQFTAPLLPPPGTTSATLEVVQATAWNDAVNVRTGINDTITWDAVDYVLPAGLYSLSGMNDAIDRLLVTGGETSGVCQLLADDATQRVVVRIGAAGHQLTLGAQSPYVILGYPANSNIPAGGDTTGVYTELAPAPASFNSINSYLVHTDFTGTDGISISGRPSSAIAQISLAGTPPGSQVFSQPINPVRVNASGLVGAAKALSKWWLTSEDPQNRITTFSPWSLLVVVRYRVKSS